MQLAHRGGFLPALIYLEMMSFWWRFGQQLGHTSAGWQQQRQQQLCSPLSPGCCEHPERLLLLKRRVPPCRLPARSRMRVRVWFVAFPDKWLPNNIITSTSYSYLTPHGMSVVHNTWMFIKSLVNHDQLSRLLLATAKNSVLPIITCVSYICEEFD